MGRTQRKATEYVKIGAHDAANESQAYACAVLELPATFSLVYESSDGRLCLFEDASGHLNAVDASRLV